DMGLTGADPLDITQSGQEPALAWNTHSSRCAHKIGPLVFADGPTLQRLTNKRRRRKRGLWPDEDPAPPSQGREQQLPTYGWAHQCPPRPALQYRRGLVPARQQ